MNIDIMDVIEAAAAKWNFNVYYPGADVVAILTGHDKYFGLDAGVLKRLMEQECPVVVNGRNVVDADWFIGAGFVYKGIGRGDKNYHAIN